MLKLTSPITALFGIGESFATKLNFLGINTVCDLITYYPFRYEDTSIISNVTELNFAENKTIKATVDKIQNVPTKSRRFLTTAKVSDDSGSIEVIWFNQRFLSKNLKSESETLLRGKLKNSSGKNILYSPEYEVIKDGDTTHLGRIVPVYNLTEGITQKWLRARIKYLFDYHSNIFDEFDDYKDENFVKRYKLTNKSESLKSIHFPENFDELKKAQHRLAFDELLEIQLKLEKRRNERKSLKAKKIKIDKKLLTEFISNLDFKPTSAQHRVMKEVFDDISSTKPMARMLEGDVGSGKTLVAIIAALMSTKAGFQTAIMVPTSVLAKQHYENSAKLLEKLDVKTEIITGSSDRKSTHNADIFIGTQALLFRKHKIFNKLNLIIVDEQHRFGVVQRNELSKFIMENNNNYAPHILTMTATPIPRSIVLALFGDIDVSIIDQMPKARIPTQTFVVPARKRVDSYPWIKEKITEGNLCYWICPLIDESDILQTKAVTTQFEELKRIYPEIQIELLHGKIKPNEKEAIIKRFNAGKTKILVSTSVIEVGMDIADANIIVIEGAERFGLAQLHQLRGRVGRRNKPSWCLLYTTEAKKSNMLFHETPSKSKERLEYFASHNDGLKLAEYDLKQRGPGEVYGTRQSGIPNLKIARLDDLEMIEITKKAAKELMK